MPPKIELGALYQRLHAMARHAGLPEPFSYELQELLCYTLGLLRDELWINPSRLLSTEETAQVLSRTKRWLEGEPLAYVLGVAFFDGLTLKVGPGVLIPRPEGEVLLDLIQPFLSALPPGKRQGLDLGTGSGSLACALNLRMASSGWRWSGSDISAVALGYARDNAAEYKIDTRWRQGSWMEPWQGERFDSIVCNPPYIAYEELGEVSGSVYHYEPHEALFAQEQGMAAYKALAETVPHYLNDHALVAFEIGWRQADPLKTIFKRYGWPQASLHRDIAGHDRFLIFQF